MRQAARRSLHLNWDGAAIDDKSKGERVTEVRRRRGEQLVSDPTLPLSEVTFLLGFSAPSSFHRAFKRWEGCTPLEHRRQVRG